MELSILRERRGGPHSGQIDFFYRRCKAGVGEGRIKADPKPTRNRPDATLHSQHSLPPPSSLPPDSPSSLPPDSPSSLPPDSPSSLPPGDSPLRWATPPSRLRLPTPPLPAGQLPPSHLLTPDSPLRIPFPNPPPDTPYRLPLQSPTDSPTCQ
ncbi:hypothetical protein H6P81_017912 [Aristolochia fimbriata]|uniref:Uncharacterized protein n=1 Tax=Aristolochia fimbriata TaxID=158543 RepID=A0AAV7DZX9_ARIFI|nr:hypothetical protein H6P81_017912 [Aristolochia fimbriata]